MSRFDLHDTILPGVILLKRKPLRDDRGFLERLFCAEDLAEAGVTKSVAQANWTLTRDAGVLRGMHFQRAPHAEMKIVSCIEGEVFDVALDLRPESATYGRWTGHRLSPENGHALVIPEGCAHGFQTLTADCRMLYFHTHPYHPEVEGGVNAQDPALAIDWPLDVSSLSPRDAALPPLAALGSSGDNAQGTDQ